MADDAIPSSRPLPDLIGGRYRIVSRLGVGGMGVVYKATDVQLNRAVAVKAVEDGRLLLPGSAARLRTEALAAASLDHPYVCKVYELVETPVETFIVMEFIEGETLSSMLKRGVLPLLQTLQFGREIAEGLADAHAHGLVHRDVKPSNVMVTSNGHVKLLDFGVSSVDMASTPGDRTHTVTPQITVFGGTPHYMAPEQAAGQPVTSRADLFSLGVMLYECLTGTLPFSGATTFDYVRNVMQSAPRRLARVAPDTPADLVDLIERCLEKTPADRPESADAIVAELRKLAGAFTSPDASFHTARQARSGRRWKTVAALALATAGIALGWRFFWPRASTDAPLRQLRPFVTSAAQVFDSRISPDGQWVSFISTSGGGSQVMVQRVDGGEPRPVTLGQGTPVSQVWSPDGKQLACVLAATNESLLQIYPAFFGGAPQQTVSLGTTLNQVKLLRWIDRAIYMEVGDNEGMSLRRVDLENGAGMTNVSASWKLPGTLNSVDVRPDGRAVAFAASTKGQVDLWTAGIDGASPTAVTADAFFERTPIWNGRGDRIIVQSNRGGQPDLWEIDPQSQAANQLTSGDAEKVPESTSVDGSLISFQLVSQNARLWLWGSADAAGRQLTQDSLSDYAPTVAANGGVVAFQRSQPTPSRTSPIIDAKLLVAPFETRAISQDARPIADGFAASLSADGTWIAYLQQGDVPAQTTLQARNLTSGAIVTLSRTAGKQVWSTLPVDWASGTLAWSAPGTDIAELFFVDQPGAATIRRYHAGDPQAGPPLAQSGGATEFFRDLYVTPDNRRLGYVSASRDAVVVHVLDLKTLADRRIATFPPSMTGAFGRGWLEKGFVLVRRVNLHEDKTGDVEVSVIDEASGSVTKAGLITNAFVGTARLHAAKRALYVTRIEDGVHNLYEFSLATGSLKALTRNGLTGVTFSGFHPVGGDALIGARQDRGQNIWLIQESAHKPPGNSAGR